jgi:hypothetical protein
VSVLPHIYIMVGMWWPQNWNWIRFRTKNTVVIWPPILKPKLALSKGLVTSSNLVAWLCHLDVFSDWGTRTWGRVTANRLSSLCPVHEAKRSSSRRILWKNQKNGWLQHRHKEFKWKQFSSDHLTPSVLKAHWILFTLLIKSIVIMVAIALNSFLRFEEIN